MALFSTSSIKAIELRTSQWVRYQLWFFLGFFTFELCVSIYHLSDIAWHWTMVENLLILENNWRQVNPWAWTCHIFLTLESLITVFYLAAYLVHSFIKLWNESETEEKTENFVVKKQKDLVKEVVRLKKFIYSNFRDTWGVCSEVLKADQQVVIWEFLNNESFREKFFPCPKSNIFHLSCYATLQFEKKLWPDLKTRILQEELEPEELNLKSWVKPLKSVRVVTFATILAEENEQALKDKEILRQRKKRKYSYTDF